MQAYPQTLQKMIKLHKPKLDISTGKIVKPAYLRAQIRCDLTPRDAAALGRHLIELSDAALKLDEKVTK